MDIEERLNSVAAKYRVEGYKVVVRPGPDDLPDFAKDFKVEIVARRDDGNVLASAKKNQSDLESDLDMPRYAEVTGNQPGWRFDLFVLGPESQPKPSKIVAAELTDEDVGRVLDEAERLRREGFVRLAFIAAWAVLETAMRRRLHAEREEAVSGSSARTMLNELYSSGVLYSGDFRYLEGLLPARNAIVHGFVSPAIEDDAIGFLIETTRKLLSESGAVKKTG